MTLNAYECWEQNNFFLEVWVLSLYSFIFGALASLVSQGAHVETVHWTRGDSGKRRACRLLSEKKAWLGLSVLGDSVWGRSGVEIHRPLIFLASPSCMAPDKSRNHSEPQSPPLKLVTMPIYTVVKTECSDLYRLVCVCRVGAQWTSSPSLKKEKLA